MPRTGARKAPSVIDLDDDEMASPGAVKINHCQSLRSEKKLQDSDKLCEFPVGKSPNITVTFQDYKTLEYDFSSTTPSSIST